MSYIPDCRTDDDYNVGKLKDHDNIVGVKMFDFTIEVLSTYFSNLNIYDFGDIGVVDVNKVLEEKSGELLDNFTHYAEMQRNELIVSMIDDEWEPDIEDV